MLDVAVGLTKELSSIFALIVVLSCGAGLLVIKRWDGALKDAGTDRDRLLRSLRLGGNPRRYYVFLIGKALNRADRLLRDADKADLSLPSPFGNRKPAPYWTGWSFDVCALIAVAYPLTSLFLTWVLTGEAGELGNRLGLREGHVAGWRWTVVAAMGWMVFALWRAKRTSGWRAMVWLIGAGAGSCAVAIGGAIAGVVALAVFVAGAIAGVFVVAGAVTVGAAGAIAVVFSVASAIAIAVASTRTGTGILFVLGVGACVAVAVAASVAWVARKANVKRCFGTFYLCFGPAAVLVCYLGVWVDIRLGVSTDSVLILIILGLIPLVNIPFDWLSIGATRALLRRGCEPGAPAPLWLALIDVVIGLVLMALLAAALIIALQAVDWMAETAGRSPLIDIPQRLKRIHDAPLDPENWWIYLTLFSTMIPSMLNAIVGMCSLTTWFLPKARARLIRKIEHLKPDDHSVRHSAAYGLAAPVFLGTFLAGLLIWAVSQAILYGASFTLTWFLWLAVAFEWLLLRVFP